MTSPLSVPRLIPRHEFFDNPERAVAKIAPDGRSIAYLAPHHGKLNVWVRSLGGGDDRPLTDDRTRGIRHYYWSRTSDAVVYKQDGGGDEEWHLHLAPIDGRPTVNVTPVDGARATYVKQPINEPEGLYVTLNDRDPSVGDLCWIDLVTHQLHRMVINDRQIRQWLIDEDGQLRAALATDPDDAEQVLVLARDGDGWRNIGRYGWFDVGLVGVAADGRLLAVTRSADRDLSSCVLLDLADGSEEVVASDPKQRVDVYAPMLRRHTGELTGVIYRDDRFRFDLADEVYADVYDLATTIQAGDPILGSHDDAERFWTVSFTSDVDPGATYLLDCEHGSHELLYRPRPWLDPDDLAPMAPAIIPSRDGLDLVSYLTLPVGLEPQHLPTVVLVHGGPWSRDGWGYHPKVQFLANRGYAVLQINYRGSTGFGRSFTEAAIGEFGRAMLDDLVDGVGWSVDRGYTDPDRVAIYGGSYGGYSALCGLTFTDVFAAGISVVGPSSLITLIESFPAYWGPNLGGSWHRFVGDPSDPAVRESLREVSPLYHAEQITSPLLVLQGANDPRVTQQESDQIVGALRQRGVPVEYLLAPDEGHGFQDPINRQAAHRAVELFLAEHLGGRVEEEIEEEVAARFDVLRRGADVAG